MKNENKGREMIDIMMHNHKEYIALLEKDVTITPEGIDSPITINIWKMHKILIGGDQLIVAKWQI